MAEEPNVPASDAPEAEAVPEPVPETAKVEPRPEETIQPRRGPRMGLGRETRGEAEQRLGAWSPKTRLGQLVKAGEVRTMGQALQTGLPIREPEIVDVLLPDLSDDVLDVNMVQRMTDSGRRVKFAITAVVGNRDGYVGIGMAKGKEVGPAIRKAIDNAKLNIIEIRRGCGSWECSCYTPHTVPFEVYGKTAAAEIVVKPAPRGIGLAAGAIARKVLELAGVKDAWTFTKGETRTTINFSQATFNALSKTSGMRVRSEDAKRLKMLSGPAGGLRRGAAGDASSPRADRGATAQEAPAAAQVVPASEGGA